MDRWTDGQMGRQTERKTCLQAPNRRGGCMAGRQTDGVTGVTVGQADSWTDFQTDRLDFKLYNVLVKEVF